MNLKAADYDEVNDKVNSLFWIVFKIIIFTALLGAVAVDAVKYVIYTIYN